MHADPTRGATSQLDPESRALIELSVIRGMADEDLAGILGIEADAVRERRERAMREMGAESAEERAALEAALRADASPEAAPPHPEPAEARARPAKRSAARRIALAGGLLIALVVAAVLALGGEDSDPEPADRPAPAGTDSPRTGRLEPIGATGAGGSARISGPEDRRVLRLTVKGLEPPADGGYVVWLYDSVSNARAVTGSRKGSFTVRAPLPAGFARYSFVDISSEPADGNPNHSGASVLRVPLEQVPGGVR